MFLTRGKFRFEIASYVYIISGLLSKLRRVINSKELRHFPLKQVDLELGQQKV